MDHVKFCHENTRIQSFLKNEGIIFDISNFVVQTLSRYFDIFGILKSHNRLKSGAKDGGLILDCAAITVM